jgi:DNA sulfur modification protein DndB
MISVVFFRDDGLKRSQQMFSDLNKNAVKPTKSLNILYDHRDAFSQFIVDLIDSIEVFKGRVDLEQTSLSNRTTKVFTLNGIADATLRFCGITKGRKISSEEKSMVKEFWETIAKNIPQWQLLLRNDITAAELRKNYVIAHTNMLNVFGIITNILRKKFPDAWKEKLAKLEEIDWSRENPEWEGRLVIKGRMVKNALGIELTANTILRKLGVKLDDDRLKFENKR